MAGIEEGKPDLRVTPVESGGTVIVVPTSKPKKERPRLWPPADAQVGDAFSTPSEFPVEDDLTGPEPAVFGGVNPATEEEEAVAAAAAEEESASQPLGLTLEDAMRGNELLPEAPPIDFARILASTPFLLTAMVALLVGSTYLIRKLVPTVTYVQTKVKFNNYTRLNEIELQDLQLEMNKTLRTYPLRAAAWELLQKRSPGVMPGFLNSGLTFHRLDSIAWEPEGYLRMRVDSDDLSNDITRLSAISEVFYKELDDRQKRVDEYRDQLKQQKQQQIELQKQDVSLKDRIDALLPDAQRYIDLKQAMQSMERYLELADESNPLRLVAKQNLIRITKQVTAARQLSLQRDDLLAERVAIQKTVEQTAQEISRLERTIDVFAYPDPPDPKQLIIYDTKPHQKLILRSTWLIIIASLGGTIAVLHFNEQRKVRKLRRERRELLDAKEGVLGEEKSTRVRRQSRQEQ